VHGGVLILSGDAAWRQAVEEAARLGVAGGIVTVLERQGGGELAARI
jgi:hypothetical protein